MDCSRANGSDNDNWINNYRVCHSVYLLRVQAHRQTSQLTPIKRVVMRDSSKTPQLTNMDELIDGIHILFGAEVLTSVAREAAASLIDELVEFKGERGLDILRALAKGEIATDDAHKLIYARCNSPAHICG